MHHQRNAVAAPAPRRASMPPPAGPVQGLGPVNALRIDVEPAQLPWLAEEIDVVECSLEDEIAHLRKRHEQLPGQAKEQRSREAREVEQELDRRAYQLEALAMIRDQLPISSDAARIACASPWDTPVDGTLEHLNCDATPIAVVGPAALMTIAIRSVMHRAADALAEALHAPELDVDYWSDSTGGWRGGELPRVSAASADKLRAIATAAHAFTDTYLHALAHQAYSFDPEYTPSHTDLLERTPACATRSER